MVSQIQDYFNQLKIIRMDNTKTSNLKLSDVCLQLEDVLKCPVCLEYLEPPITLCQSGHGVCKLCKFKNKLIECPICRGPFSEFKATLLTQMMEVLPRMCKYRAEGCSVISLLQENHIKFCRFRQINCRFNKCEAVTSANLLFSHYEKTHSSIQLLPLEETRHFVTLWSKLGHLFWIVFYVDIEKQGVFVTLTQIPLSKPAKKYIANIKIEKDNFEYS